ncbi:MAG: response regulator [bacterium]
MPKHILVIDDQESMRSITKSMLETEGYKVTEAEDGAEGLELFQEDPADFDLVLADVNMPKMDGFELLKAIKEEHLEIPVILLTGINENVAEAVGTIYKADAIIRKPYKVEEALAVIKKLLG